ncbi:hypothetical protein ACS0TY_029343 [Phlomoides rotata]
MEASWLYALISLMIFLIITLNYSSTKTKLPPAPFPPLPLLGHLHLLKFPLHRTCHSLSLKLGPIFSLRLGTRLTVVVSSPAIVEECFTKNDIVLANRPRFIAAKYIGYNYASLAAAPYGDYWRELRRLTTVEVFSNARLNSFQFIRHDEVKLMLKKLCRNSDQNSGRVELRPLLSELTFNNIMRMVCGKRYFGVDKDNDDEESKEIREVIKEAITYGGVSNPVDFFPVLRWIDYKDVEKNLSRITRRMDGFLQGLIDSNRRNKDGSTMIHHLLSLQESEPEYYTDVVIKSIIMVMLLAGTDTSWVTIEWGMSALLNHPEKLEKAREELNNIVGNNRVVNESDIHKLPYLQNIISETMRLFPAAPLLVPHEASADLKVAGYDIPRGTILLVNAWAIHRDPTVWEDPTTFKPERFEGGEFGPSKFLPFGMGRRSCPGIGLAQRVVSLTIASLIQCFDWQRIDDGLVDMGEGKTGISIHKNIPLVISCKARDVLQTLFEN